MGKGDFSGQAIGAAEKSGPAGAVMWCAEGACGMNYLFVADEGIELCDGNNLFLSGPRKKTRDSACEHAFAGAGWTAHEKIVSSGDSDSEGALGLSLADNLVERISISCFCIFYNICCGDFWVNTAFEILPEFTKAINWYKLNLIL